MVAFASVRDQTTEVDGIFDVLPCSVVSCAQRLGTSPDHEATHADTMSGLPGWDL
jgi:hypothetical protein